MVEAREAAAEHDHIGVDHVDDDSEAAREPVGVSREGGSGEVLAGRGATHDLLAVGGIAAAAQVGRRQRGSCNPGFHAAASSAPAERARHLVGCGPGQGIVAPFAADTARAVEDAAVDDDPGAASRAENDADDSAGAGGGPVAGLGERKAVGVVGKPHRLADGRGQVGSECAAVEPGRVCVLDSAGARRERAGGRHTDGGGASAVAGARRVGEQALHHRRNGRDRRVVVVARRGNALARPLVAGSVHHHAFDLGAAQINSDEQRLRPRRYRHVDLRPHARSPSRRRRASAGSTSEGWWRALAANTRRSNSFASRCSRTAASVRSSRAIVRRSAGLSSSQMSKIPFSIWRIHQSSMPTFLQRIVRMSKCRQKRFRLTFIFAK